MPIMAIAAFPFQYLEEKEGFGQMAKEWLFSS
jgi:hypothetical protein